MSLYELLCYLGLAAMAVGGAALKVIDAHEAGAAISALVMFVVGRGIPTKKERQDAAGSSKDD